MTGHVRFEEFWPRLKDEFAKAPGPEAGVHILSVRKWTQDKGYLPTPPFTAIWKGGDVIYCDTEKTDIWRTVPAAEFRKVYQAWEDYRADRKGRSFIAHDLGVQNATWIIPILYQFEHLMKAGS
jgi:hypothetical protein